MTKDSSFALKVQESLCISCGLCVDACPYNAIKMDDYPCIDPYSCRLCGSCVNECSSGALTLDVPKMNDKPQPPAASGIIWVLVETENKGLAAVTRELLGKARELSVVKGHRVEAVLVGHEVDSLASDLIACGAERVHVVDSPCLEYFVEEKYAEVVAGLSLECHPDILLVGATPCGRGLSARLAVLLKTGLTADCTELVIDEESGLLHQIRPAFGGNMMATIVTPETRPQMASVRPGVMKALPYDASLKGDVLYHEIDSCDTDERIRIINEVIEKRTGVSLTDSSIVVGIGRGVRSRDVVDKISAWADSMGAVVAGSRAAVEAGLIDARFQVGQTGHAISPDLYIAIGISGQIQHTAAIGGSKKIIAINSDPSAPIFKIADFGFVTPIEGILSQLTANEVL